MTAVILGIDLGTTNSLAAWLNDEGRPEVIRHPGEGALCPSVVAFSPTGEPPVVGNKAVSLATQQAETQSGWVVHSVKRLMGRGLPEVVGEVAHLPYRVVDSRPGDELNHQEDTASGRQRGVWVTLPDGRYLRPQEISAVILSEVKARAEAALGTAISEAVITVPAYFDETQRQATRDAGRIAGLRVRRIMAEPTAAALAYGLDRRQRGRIAVYDLGGGTFDVSILRLSGGVFQVLATSGDTRLGGDDFDRLVIDEMQARHRANYGRDLPDNPPDRQRQRQTAQSVRVALSSQTAVPLIVGDTHLGVLSRDELDRLAQPLIARTIAACQRALTDAELAPGDIDDVVMAGGVTRMPAVREAVRAYFGRQPHTDLNPDEVVALGAAVQAGMLAGRSRDANFAARRVLDVIPLSLGIETAGGGFNKLIVRNAAIPASATEVFTTAADNQTGVELHILQGERELAADARSLGRVRLTVPPMPAGWPKLAVTFLVDENGLLTVSAHEQRSGATIEHTVTPTHGLTAAEVDRMVSESVANARADVDAHQVVSLRQEITTMLRATDKALARHGGDLEANQRAAIMAAVENCRTALDTRDKDALADARSQLNAATVRLAEFQLDRAFAETITARQTPRPSTDQADRDGHSP